MSKVRRDQNFRESWYATSTSASPNNANKKFTIGDLPTVPSFDKVGQTHDLLRFCGREKISHSKNLVTLVDSLGWLTLNKKKINRANDVVDSVVDDAITPAEENEAGGGSGTAVEFLNDLLDVTTAGGVTGDVLTQQLDGSFALEAAPGASGGSVTPAEKSNLELEFKILLTDITTLTEFTYTGKNVTAIDIWTDAGKTTKLFNQTLSYTGKQLTSTVCTRISDSATLTKAFAYSGSKLISVTAT